MLDTLLANLSEVRAALRLRPALDADHTAYLRYFENRILEAIATWIIRNG